MSTSCSPDVPPFHGYVETTVHALRLIHAARQGVIPRITRRLNDTERRTMIKSGAVFVFSVEESGIKRWTDGMLWSPSRIVGNFLVYREINERASSRGNHKKSYSNQDDRSVGRSTANAFKGPSTAATDQGTFKPNGLIKKTITVTIEGSDLHLISYYTSEDIRLGRLKKPTSRADIMSLYMPPHIFRLTNFRVPPKVEIGPDGKARLVAEAEDIEVKVEEQAYSPSDSPNDDGSPIDSSYGGNIYSPMSQSSMNHVRGDRWGADNMRVSTPVRPSTAMSMSSSPSIPYTGLSSRREMTHGGGGGDSWPTLHSPARWSSDYETTSSSNNSSSFYPIDNRSRVRPQPYQNSVPRDADSGRYSSSSVLRRYDIPSLRSPWLVNQDDKDAVRRSSYSGHSSGGGGIQQHYSVDGYHYGGSWTSSDSSSSSFPSHSPLASFDSSYSSNDTKLPAVDSFGSSTDDFADS